MRRVWIGLGVGLAITAALAVVLSAIFSPPEAVPTPTEAVDYPFALREPVTFVVDFSQHHVCDARFAGGQVLGLDGAAVDGLVIAVRAAGGPEAILRPQRQRAARSGRAAGTPP